MSSAGSSPPVNSIMPWIKYYAIVNVISLALFAADKVKASIGSYRISEKDLCTVSLLGGWPAGLAAMFGFNHKLKKKSFLAKFAMVTVANLAITYYVQKR
jgi:uncharacterized membrane protein YsdA (DUF1294 family)